MLSISEPLKGSAQVGYYFKYYSEHAREPVQWAGQGAQLLGLSGPVAKTDFYSIAKGFHPNGSKLVQNAGAKNRQFAWDLTFSVSKSVSVLWAVAPEEIQKEIETCAKLAVTDALEKVDSEFGQSRKGKAGKDFVPAALTSAVFLHNTSRSEDPQIHFHCLLMNVGVREDGTTGGIWTKEIFKNKIAIGTFFSDRLRHHLEQNLGLEITPEKTGFHINGVPKELCREFSKRRQDIETELAVRGLKGGKAAKIVAAQTRDKKKHTPLKELFPEWRNTAEAYGFDREAVLKLVRSPKSSLINSEREQQTTARRATGFEPKTERSNAERPRQPHTDLTKEIRVFDAAEKQELHQQQERQADSQAKDQVLTREREKVQERERAKEEHKARERAQEEKAHEEERANRKADAHKKRQEHAKKKSEKKTHLRFAEALKHAVDRAFPEKRTRPQVLRLAYKLAHDFKVDPKLVEQFVDDLKLPHHGDFYRVEWRKLVKQAPDWSPLAAKVPRIVLSNTHQKWDRVLWRKAIPTIGKPTHEIRIQMRKPFAKAPGWNPLSKLALPAIRVAKQPPLPPTGSSNEVGPEHERGH